MEVQRVIKTGRRVACVFTVIMYSLCADCHRQLLCCTVFLYICEQKVQKSLTLVDVIWSFRCGGRCCISFLSELQWASSPSRL